VEYEISIFNNEEILLKTGSSDIFLPHQKNDQPKFTQSKWVINICFHNFWQFYELHTNEHEHPLKHVVSSRNVTWGQLIIPRASN